MALLIANPVRNVRAMESCFRMPGGIMDVPPGQLHLEFGLIELQLCAAALGTGAAVLCSRRRRLARATAAAGWLGVALAGVWWARRLGQYSSGPLPQRSILACVLDARSAHTHGVLSNAPFLIAVALAIAVSWEARPVNEHDGPDQPR